MSRPGVSRGWSAGVGQESVYGSESRGFGTDGVEVMPCFDKQRNLLDYFKII